MGGGNGTSAPDAPLRRWRGPARRAVAELPFLLAAAVVAAVAVWPVLEVHRDGLKSDVASYFEIFNASAMFATGHGLVEGAEGHYPELRAFLHCESTKLATPANPDAVTTFPLRYPFARSHYYLLLSVGCWWRVFGVSVASFLAFAGVVYVLCILTVYALFRAGCGRVVSLLGALCMATSPAWLMMAPSLRDFSKAPFVLAFLALAGWCARGRLSGRGLVGWSLLTGFLLGAGWGFRSDLLVCLPPALLLPWVVRVDAAHGRRWRLTAATALLLAFSTLGTPVFLATHNNGGALYVHSMMQGLSDQSESAMSFGDASYTGFSNWCDPSAHAAAAAYALNRGDLPPMENFDSPSYLQAARLYFSEMIRTFPADFFRRGLASAWSVSGVAASVCRGDHAAGTETAPVLDRWIRLHQPLAAHLETFGMLYLLLALAVACALNLRTAAILAVLAVYIGAYPSLLYQTRHVFHLTCLYYLAPAWLLVQSGRWVCNRMRARSAGPILRPLLRAAAGAAVFLSLLAGTGWCLDRVQQRSVHRLLEQYRDVRLESVPYRETPHGDGWVLFAPVKPVPGLEPERDLEIYEAATALLVLRLEGGAPVFPVRMVYAHGSVTDFTQEFYPLLEQGSDAGGFNCFLPVIELAWPGPVSGDASGAATRGRFLGVAVPVAQRSRVAGLSRVTNAAQTPYPLFMAVPDDLERFVQPKSGPWNRLWPLLSVCCAGTPLDRAERLAEVAERYPHDAAARRALEQLTDSTPDPLVQVLAWQTLAGLHPDRVTDAGVELDRLAERLGAAGDNESALRVYKAAVTVASAALWHRENLGKQYERMGRSKDALEQYILRLSAQPDSPDIADRVDRLFDGDHAAALAFWRELAERYPDAFVPAHHLARACRAVGDVPGALAAHERASALKADQPQQLLEFGADLLAAKQWDRAVGTLRQAVRLEDTLAPAAADLCAKAAADRLGAGDAATAAALAKEAALFRPEDRSLRMEAAAAMKAAGDVAGAVAAVSEVMASSPDEYVAAQLDQLMEGFAPEDSVSRWRMLADGNPKCMACRVHLGAALERAGRPDEARQVYEDTLRVEPELPAALLRLGSLLTEQGRENEGLPMVDRGGRGRRQSGIGRGPRFRRGRRAMRRGGRTGPCGGAVPPRGGARSQGCLAVDPSGRGSGTGWPGRGCDRTACGRAARESGTALLRRVSRCAACRRRTGAAPGPVAGDWRVPSRSRPAPVLPGQGTGRAWAFRRGRGGLPRRAGGGPRAARRTNCPCRAGNVGRQRGIGAVPAARAR